MASSSPNSRSYPQPIIQSIVPSLKTLINPKPPPVPMLIRRVAALSTTTIPHLRRFSTAALLQEFETPPEFSYLEGLPRPDPKYDETIYAIPRAISGKNIAAKERKAGRVPSIVFEAEGGQHGGNKRLISVKTNQIKKLVNHMGRSFFLSRVFDLEVRPEFESDEIVEKVRVLPRKVWVSPFGTRCSLLLQITISGKGIEISVPWSVQ